MTHRWLITYQVADPEIVYADCYADAWAMANPYLHPTSITRCDLMLSMREDILLGGCS